MGLWRDIKGTLEPFWITLGYLFKKPMTIQYPEQKRTPSPRYRARIVLTRDPDGDERCVACHLCSAACPVDCISMQAAEDADGRRYAEWFRINFRPLHLLRPVRRGLSDPGDPDVPGLRDLPARPARAGL